MKTVRTIHALRSWVKTQKRNRRSVGLVPTMGNLHDGHLALIKKACRENDRVVVSAFVNPAQFDQRADYRMYRRTPRSDQAAARGSGADILFVPSVRLMYPRGFSTRVREEKISAGLCGRFRSGHFEGVTTVVTKLFNMVEPDQAYFGQKDAQQVAVVKQVVRDLNFQIKIRVVPIVRDRDGLALSSRNERLSKKDHSDALKLSRALAAAKRRARQGERNPRVLGNLIRSELRNKGLRIEYVEIVDPKTLQRLNRIRDRALIAVCIWVRRTRLIDNVIVKGKS